jgi:lipoprotein-releasing system permease protein
VQGLVFLQRNNRVYTPIMRGIDPRYEKDVSRVPDYIKNGKFSVGEDEMMVGSDLARQMNARVGEKILVYSPQRFTKADEVFLPEELKVSGIFDLGMWDFDIGYVLTSLEKARSLFQMEDGVQGVQVMTRDPMHVEVVAEELREKLGAQFYVTTWKEQNRTLFAQLEVENNLMLLLLAFILVVACFAIASTLITLTFRKTREIGLLKAVGVSSPQVLLVFMWQGLISGVIGCVAGLGLGRLVLYYRNDLLTFLRRALHFDILPKELYHLAELPATVTWADVILISSIAIVMSSVAALIPAGRAASIDPVKALRYE